MGRVCLHRVLSVLNIACAIASAASQSLAAIRLHKSATFNERSLNDGADPATVQPPQDGSLRAAVPRLVVHLSNENEQAVSSSVPDTMDDTEPRVSFL
ncbi:hypothetical protein DFJ74DRAFT_676574 [Hyaloraphidium curvatum]|nr:hypothetical protein DFJ74DRAFT_676574 [Hyaloraphidium curvatum]